MVAENLLAFDNIPQNERTKHMHGMHPYKGKFIPQLVEYFLDDHTDELKSEVFFNKGDVILDPFCGSGTTLVVAKELGMWGVGCDINEFSILLSNVKTKIMPSVSLEYLRSVVKDVILLLDKLDSNIRYEPFEIELKKALNAFNKNNFGKAYKNSNLSACEKKELHSKLEREFQDIYWEMVNRYHVPLHRNRELTGKFLIDWLFPTVRNQAYIIRDFLYQNYAYSVHDFFWIVLSRSVRSCRLTRHSDLATLKEPCIEPYFCRKHSKICMPVFSMNKKFEQYAYDAIDRLEEYRYNIENNCVSSYPVDIMHGDIDDVKKRADYPVCNGVFTSPPYVSLIDYEEQHIYAHELFDLDSRNPDLEIGNPKFGISKKAMAQYSDSMVHCLVSMSEILVDGANVFIVVNDKYDLYPDIFNRAGYDIVKRYERPVLNRSEKKQRSI